MAVDITEGVNVKNLNNRLLVIPLAVLVALSGCATHGGIAGADAEASNHCDPVAGAIAGAIIGGILGAMVGGRHSGGAGAAGAAVGAGIGALACVAVNAKTQQTRTSAEVEAEYRSNTGVLPVEAQVTAYDIRVVPSGVVQSGGQFQLVSTIDILQGTQISVDNVTERVTLYRADNSAQELATLEKVASQKPASGTFENTFTFTLPKGVPAGSYPVQTTVYLNGQPVANRSSYVRVVMNDAQIFAARPLSK